LRYEHNVKIKKTANEKIFYTLSEIRNCEKEFLTPQDISKILSCTPYTINIQARDAPEKLGFPICIMGTRVRIPREGFITWCEGKNTLQEQVDYKNLLKAIADALKAVAMGDE